jgi:hypothetical protein
MPRLTHFALRHGRHSCCCQLCLHHAQLLIGATGLQMEVWQQRSNERCGLRCRSPLFWASAVSHTNNQRMLHHFIVIGEQGTARLEAGPGNRINLQVAMTAIVVLLMFYGACIGVCTYLSVCDSPPSVRFDTSHASSAGCMHFWMCGVRACCGCISSPTVWSRTKLLMSEMCWTVCLAGAAMYSVITPFTALKLFWYLLCVAVCSVWLVATNDIQTDVVISNYGLT